jgi:hypothetical protein
VPRRLAFAAEDLMRLTLRTLLAYLDEILEPADTQDIAKKLEESEFATQLVHRTRDCMRRLRLGVPAVLGRGLASDPNTVAEYLDNTLPGDRVAEFEKICLESDVHLAEVAACHQILTLVLGGPVEIPSEARQRMYTLANYVDAPPVQTDAIRPAAAAAVAPPVPPPRRPKPEVPDYLREPRSRFWPLAATVLITGGLTFGLLMYFDAGGMRERLTALGTSAETEEPTEAVAEGSPEADRAMPTEEAEATEPAARSGAATEEPSSETDEPSNSKPDGDLTPPLQPVEDPAAPDAPEPSDGPPAASAKADDDRMPDEKKPLSIPVNEAPEAGAPAAAADAPAARGDAEGDAFGRYMSKQEVLLRFDEPTGDWRRLGSMAALAKGDRLLSLPSFRPTIMLSTNISIQPEGGTMFELKDWTDDGVPIIGIEYGRFLMMTVGKAGNSVQIAFEDQTALLTFVDAESTLAIDARRVFPAGTDPGGAAAPLSIELYVTSGQVRVKLADNLTEVQAAGRKLLAGSADAFGADFPKWATSGEPQTDTDRRAAAELESMLPADDRGVGAKLKELSTARRREVRSLAIRSGCYLDVVEPCILALNDPQEKQYWTGPDAPYILELRAAVSRSPQTAAKVRAVLDKTRANDSAALYRMLWGYSAEDLKNGADRDLVEGLEHDSLDYRVLAAWNLQSITGLANLGYYPADLAGKRRTPVKSWQKHLRDGKIVPRAAAPTRPKNAASKSS